MILVLNSTENHMKFTYDLLLLGGKDYLIKNCFDVHDFFFNVNANGNTGDNSAPKKDTENQIKSILILSSSNVSFTGQIKWNFT